MHIAYIQLHTQFLTSFATQILQLHLAEYCYQFPSTMYVCLTANIHSLYTNSYRVNTSILVCT
jgi:hypothetical protein